MYDSSLVRKKRKKFFGRTFCAAISTRASARALTLQLPSQRSSGSSLNFGHATESYWLFRFNNCEHQVNQEERNYLPSEYNSQEINRRFPGRAFLQRLMLFQVVWDITRKSLQLNRFSLGHGECDNKCGFWETYKESDKIDSGNFLCL